MSERLVLVDTNVVSYMFRDDTRAAYYRSLLGEFDEYAISFQTLAELQFWMDKRRWGTPRRVELEMLLREFTVMLCDENTCARWAHIRAGRERIGRPLSAEDAWIAATALDLGCPLITHDAGDFDGISGLELLTAK